MPESGAYIFVHDWYQPEPHAVYGEWLGELPPPNHVFITIRGTDVRPTTYWDEGLERRVTVHRRLIGA